MQLKKFLIPQKIQQLKSELKEKGLREFIKSIGWKMLLGIFLFYLVRDVFLYLLIPYLIARGLFF